jgi:two-component system response regulator YesN
MHKILIADDERCEREGVKSLIAKSGYAFNILEACNGSEALELAREYKPEILFSDIDMPLMTGLELTQKVKEFDKDIDVILLSGENNFDYALTAIRLGVADFLPKPINLHDFQNAMSKVVDKLRAQVSDSGDDKIIKLQDKTLKGDKQHSRTDVERVKSYIYKHYSEQLSVELLASKVFLSPGYMSCIFKKETGIGISQFITSYRMEKAKGLLMETNMKVVQISREVGFNNSAYFGKSFKECFGCSPEQYRKGMMRYEKNA